MDIQTSLDQGTYSEWISSCPTSYHEILSRITEQLDILKTWPSDRSRLDAFYNLIRYYSQANKNYQETSLRMHSAIEVSERRLRKGDYNSQELAERFLANVERYDREVTAPLCEQIGKELRREFPSSHTLFLGRDFTPVYLYLTKKYGKNPLHHMANVSRNVRDVAIAGRMHELKTFLRQLGLEKNSLIQNGLVITDAGKRGRIPAAILRALTLDMDETEIYTFLRHAHVRYMKSTKLDHGEEIHRKVKELSSHHRVSSKALDKLLPANGVHNVKEFRLNYPKQTKKFVNQRNKILEWRPKSVEVALNFGGTGLVTKGAETPADIISLLLGLHADLTLSRLAEGAAAPVATTREDMPRLVLVKGEESRSDKRMERRRSDRASSKSVDASKDFRSELDQISRHRRLESFRKWREHVPHSVKQLYENTATPPGTIIGQGTNNAVYLMDGGTSVVKKILEYKNARKNLLMVWVESLVKQYGISIAQILGFEPNGITLSQEYIPGDSLESRYGDLSIRDIPEHIRNQVLQQWECAKELARKESVWLDLKAANYQEQINGTIVNVDYSPRLNSTYYRFFKSSHGRSLKEKDFLELFFKYDQNRTRRKTG